MDNGNVNEGLPDRYWLENLLKSEEILAIQDTYQLEKNVEISSLVLIDEPLTNDLKFFLDKILLSVDIQDNMYRVIEKPIAYKILRNAYIALKNVFIFGLNINEIGLKISINTLDCIRFDGKTFINGPSLSELKRDSHSKTFLWQSVLKPAFNK